MAANVGGSGAAVVGQERDERVDGGDVDKNF
jgi:hypothetical protein